MTRCTVLPFPFQSPTSFYNVGIGEEKLKLRPEWAHIKERDMGEDKEYTWGAKYICVKNGEEYERIAQCLPGQYDSTKWCSEAASICNSLNSRASLVEEVERLREALAALVNEYVELVKSGDCGFWGPEKEDEVIAARKALEKTNA